MVDMDKNLLINKTSGKEYQLQPLGDAGACVMSGLVGLWVGLTGRSDGHGWMGRRMIRNIPVD